MNPNNPHEHQHPHQAEPLQPLAGDTIQPGQPLPPMSPESLKMRPKDWRSIIIGLLVVGAIIAGIVFLFNFTPGAKKNVIKKNGLQATAVSIGKAFVSNQRLSKYSHKVTYRANYEYTATDGKEYTVTGDKDYESEANVASRVGMKAEIRYDIDDPYHPVFITEQ